MHTKEKFHLTARWMCFAVLIFAAVLRLGTQPQVQSGLKRTAARVAARMQVRQEIPEETVARSSYPVLQYAPPRRGTAVELRPEDAALVDIRNGAEAEFDAEELIARPLKFDAGADGPLVLIVHTHGTEAYTPTAEDDYAAAGSYHTEDTRHNVVQVGQVLADRLTARGIETINDDTLCDQESYNDSYLRSAEVIEAYLEKYPSIQMVLDIHRDAAEDADGNPVALTAEADGEACAELMLVVGTDEGGLSHPDWQENLANALKIQTLLNRSAPGLCRNLNLRTERFNQHETPGSLLVEVGASGNTLAEALRSARILGQALAVFLRGQMHDDTD